MRSRESARIDTSCRLRLTWLTGKLSIHPAGYGFLISEKPGQPDVFIAAENVGTAMHRDRVVARISPEPPAGRIKGRREGRVIRILERAHDTIVGTLQRSRNFYYVVPDDPRFVHDIYVRPVAAVQEDRRSETAATVGDKVVVRLDDWQSRHVNPEGEIIEVLGPASAPGVDVLSIIRKYHLPTEFPSDVLEQAERIPESVDAQQIAGREDLRNQFIVTIDPDDARDFDDAIQRGEACKWRLAARRAHRRCCGIRGAGQRVRPRGAAARQQRLSARPRHPDVAGAVEQRCLQPQAASRSAHALGFYSVRQTWRGQERALCAERDSQCAPPYVQRSIRDFKRRRLATDWANGFILPGSLPRYCGENDSNTARWSLIFQR